MRGGFDPGHVHADLGDDDLGGALADARDGPQQHDLPAERGSGSADARVEVGDGLGQVVEVAQVQPAPGGVRVAKPAGQRQGQVSGLAAQGAFGPLSEGLGITLAGNQRLEHRPPGHAQGIGGDRVQLDPAVLPGPCPAAGPAGCVPRSAWCGSGSADAVRRSGVGG
jgi:hypothetical protein